MGRLSSTQAESLPASEFALSETIRRVKFLASQLRGLDAPRLIQVKVPSGGTLQWEISNGTDRPDYAAEIEGVIAAYDARNAYWLKPYGDGPKESPTCSSDNGVWGTDTDGNEFRCADCPRNVIGTDAKGRGKACKNMVRLHGLDSDEWYKVVNTPFLALDDFGATRYTEFAQERMYRFINDRINANKPTAITTNLSLDDIKYPPKDDEMTGRIYERVMQLTAGKPICFDDMPKRRIQAIRRDHSNSSWLDDEMLAEDIGA
ncbi:hypothetical protein AGMMS49992_22200 [Clostridia bacterium]|nr:hypothetical protein AGMMS49992_22200 [Clostridia bacterium]